MVRTSTRVKGTEMETETFYWLVVIALVLIIVLLVVKEVRRP
jgi:hypothetical protein